MQKASGFIDLNEYVNSVFEDVIDDCASENETSNSQNEVDWGDDA